MIDQYVIGRVNIMRYTSYDGPVLIFLTWVGSI